jgi:hypothetical protein
MKQTSSAEAEPATIHDFKTGLKLSAEHKRIGASKTPKGGARASDCSIKDVTRIAVWQQIAAM